MSNKKIILIMCTVIALAVTTAFATGIVGQIQDDAIVEPVIDTVSEQSIADIVYERIENNDSIKLPEQIKSIINCCHRAKYENVASYVNFICQNSFTSSQVKVINKILESGTTIQSLSQIYDFWLTTDEPFSIIEDICALESEYFSEFWYEDAFNFLTKNKHGVLNAEDVQAYIDEGISTDDILTANVLSRRDGQNINDILDRVKNGENIENIICEIYDVTVLPEEESNFEKVNMLVKAQRYNVAPTVINSAKINSFIEDAEQTYGGIILDKISAETQRLNISIPDNSDDEEALKSANLPIKYYESTIK